MRVLKSWLKEYIEFNWSDQELSDKLLFSGTLVDNFYSSLDDNIVVAEILKISKHPNADKLQIAEVFDGKDKFIVVCGAPNIKIGQYVPFAKIGAKVSDSLIEKANIRGVESYGMLCSEFELGLGKNHDGILILDKSCKTGHPISQYLESDTVFDLEITPNRGDCLSHFGIAREIGALLNKSVKKTPLDLKMSNENSSDTIKLDVIDKEDCPNYFARVVKNVTVAPSPLWLKSRLLMCGIKPVNNIVDITNYIMLDIGQPLHAFDLNKISDHKIIVRKSKKSESLTTIDHEVQKLTGNELLIADSKKPIAVAGLMGSADSEISNSTRDVVIEAAEFDRKIIRQSSKILSLVTEASYRFERGTDSSSIEYAINKAVKLIQEIAGGSILSGIVKHQTIKPLNKFKFDFNKINNFLGTSLNQEQINQMLTSLGFKISNHICTVPSYRHDVSIWQDLAEEIIRIYGLEKIKPIPLKKSSPLKKSRYFYIEYIKDILANAGFSEIFSYPFMSKSDLKNSNIKSNNLLEIINPIQPENKYLRNSLIPGLLKAVSKNPTFDPVLLFEVGNTFNKQSEKTFLGVIASGKSSDKYIENAENLIINTLKSKHNINLINISTANLKLYKIKKSTAYAFEFDLTDIDKNLKLKDLELKQKIVKSSGLYRPVSKFPSITRDLAFIVDSKTDSKQISDAIYQISDLINRVELFDEFSSDKFGKNKKNMAYHIYLQSATDTLTDIEANKLIKQIIKSIENKCNAKLRA